MDGAHDFDFLHGSWRVANRQLRERLTGSDDWREFGATLHVRPVLGGLGNIDSFQVDGESFEGMTLRLFDLDARRWRIHWADTRRGALDPPLSGTFANGTGTFYGDDAHEGRPVRVRFIWQSIDADTARWEQAFSTDGGRTWEVNWIMDFKRM